MAPILYASISRISDLRERRWEALSLERPSWETGDYVVDDVLACAAETSPAELDSGRIMYAATGDLLMGALGSRSATLETVGDWTAIGPDLRS